MSVTKEVCEMVAVAEENGEIVRKVVGTFTLADGALSVQPGPGSSVKEFQWMLETPAHSESGGRIYAVEQPARWFHEPPYTFHGTFYARMRKGE